MLSRHLAWILLCLAAFALTACRGERPAPTSAPAQITSSVPTFTPSFTPQQPASPLVLVVTQVVTRLVTIEVTPTPTPSQTPLPRERLSEVPGMPDWLFVDGFGNYGTTGGYNLKTDDYLFRARFRTEDWELVGGPALRHRHFPDCTLYFFYPGLAQPKDDTRPIHFTAQILPADMASIFARYVMKPESHYLGEDPQLGATCQFASQEVVDTLQLAPASPGFVATPTPHPKVAVHVDARDPSWSVYSSYDLSWGRYEMYYPTADWEFVADGSGLLRSRALPGCWLQIKWGPADPAQGEVNHDPVPEMTNIANSIEEIISTYHGANKAAQAQCSAAAQRIANTVYWVSDCYNCHSE